MNRWIWLEVAAASVMAIGIAWFRMAGAEGSAAIADVPAVTANAAPAGEPRPAVLAIGPLDPAGLRVVLEQGVVDGCLACHKGDLGFGAWSVADLDAAIAEIAQGADHVVPVSPLGAEDRRLLAEALVNAEPAP